MKKRGLTFPLHLLPTAGILGFLGLYILSSYLYPGGSQADLSTEGFDWVNNYWCNLLNTEAMNGQPNPARPYAISAMIVLCTSLAIFFYQFPIFISVERYWKGIIQITGMLSMIFAVFIFTEFHDLMTTLSSIFGLFTLIGIIKGLIKNQLTKYIWTAGIAVILLGVNNYIYYTEYYLYRLPLIQKITFAVVLLWVISLNIRFVRAE